MLISMLRQTYTLSSAGKPYLQIHSTQFVSDSMTLAFIFGFHLLHQNEAFYLLYFPQVSVEMLSSLTGSNSQTNALKTINIALILLCSSK